MLQKIHRQIQASCPNKEAHDFVVYTDGSGYTDGYGGSASYMRSQKYDKQETRLASFSHTTTDRAEFEALLMGLQSILECMDWTSKSDIERLSSQPNKPTVIWFTDRESLVLSIWRNEDGETIFRRKKQKDLWARFEFYESVFDISPILIPRNSEDEHAFVDRLASESRLLVKEYLEIVKLDRNGKT